MFGNVSFAKHLQVRIFAEKLFRFQEETICLLRQFETCKFIVVLKYYWAIPSLNVIHQTWFTCLVCSCSAPTVFAGRLLHNLIQTARGRGMERTTDGQKLSQGSAWEDFTWQPNIIKIIPCRPITMEQDSFIVHDDLRLCIGKDHP